jgi:hypothetical protein
MPESTPFASLPGARRIWAIASVHAEADRLRRLHRQIARHFAIGDRLIYLGNVIGRGRALHETLTELFAFRRAVIAGPGMFLGDVVVLRGAQEEMWQKLLLLQFSAAPGEVLRWMIDHGVGATIEAYGGDPGAGLRAVREGTVGLARWTRELRTAMNARPGHTAFLSALKRAAFTETPGKRGKLLFVNAGIDTTRPLSAQSDSFWWASNAFRSIAAPFGDYGLIVRGSDPRHAGCEAGDFTLSIDGGSGFDGPLLGACLGLDGEVIELLEA